MEIITHEVRLANWKTIVEQCSNRSHGKSVRQWLADNDINEKTYYYWLRRIRREVYSQFDSELPSESGKTKPSVAFAEIPVKNTVWQTFDPFKADVHSVPVENSIPFTAVGTGNVCRMKLINISVMNRNHGLLKYIRLKLMWERMVIIRMNSCAVTDPKTCYVAAS